MKAETGFCDVLEVRELEGAEPPPPPAQKKKVNDKMLAMPLKGRKSVELVLSMTHQYIAI